VKITCPGRGNALSPGVWLVNDLVVRLAGLEPATRCLEGLRGLCPDLPISRSAAPWRAVSDPDSPRFTVRSGTQRARHLPSSTVVGTSAPWCSSPSDLRITSVRQVAPHRSTPELTLGSLWAGADGRWLLMAVRGHLGGTRAQPHEQLGSRSSGHGGVCGKVSLRHHLERRWAPKVCATWSDSGDQEN
jgi:hypothetical protein